MINIRLRKMKPKEAASNRQQATGSQATKNKGRKDERTNGRMGQSPVRHCGLDPQSPFFRGIGFVKFIRREASRLYSSGDSNFRQNDEYSNKGFPACCMLLVAFSPFPAHPVILRILIQTK
jgi:hypothetical protein